MLTLGVDTDLDAPLSDVWSVLSELSTFEAWNPVMRRIDGELKIGNPLTLHIAFPDGEHPVPVQVSKLEPEHQLGWSFVERSPWLYRGEHVFTLRATGPRTTRLEDREYFWGLLVPFRRRALESRIPKGMTLMGRRLDDYVRNRR